ncbi:MAG: glycine/betaine/sarcosine/D-proline family reductase selenoprotein B [Acidimicrobiia bacterium]|nr:glycine/betaine/sarcosine/D-proline family reductase selenoprotein B [Acidimicrobiia bacterium]
MSEQPEGETETDSAAETETIEQLRQSFWYGSRSNLDFKYLKDLSDAEFGDFVQEMLAAVSATMDTGDAAAVIDTAYRWQIQAYRGHLGDPNDFPHRYEDVPINAMAKPLAQSRLTLVTSSGHFVDGDDPKPFGVESMTQAEAEARIGEFLREAPSLSTIPVDVDVSQLRVRHGGYPTASMRADHQVGFPLGHLTDLVTDGVIGELNPTAYSFSGAASQVRLKKTVAPEWAQRLADDGTEAVLLVPI